MSEPSFRILAIVEADASPEEQQALNIGPQAPVIRCIRTRRIDDWLLFERTVLVRAHIPQVSMDDARTPVIGTGVAPKYGLAVGQIVERATRVPVTPEAASALNVASSLEAVAVSRIVRLLSGDPVEWSTIEALPSPI